MRAADMPSIVSDQSSSAMSPAPSIRVNAVRRHLKPEGLERGSSMFDRLDKRRERADFGQASLFPKKEGLDSNRDFGEDHRRQTK